MKRTLAAALSIGLLSLLAPACGSVDEAQGDPCSSSRNTQLLSIPPNDPPEELGPIDFLGCIARSPDIDVDSGAAACLVLEARTTMGACDCAPEAGRVDVASEHQGAVEEAKATDRGQQQGWNCFCEIPQLASGEEQEACLNDTESSPKVGGEPIRGWCYVDATTSPPRGNPQLVTMCPPQERRVLRIVGQSAEPILRTLLLMCETNACEATVPSGG